MNNKQNRLAELKRLISDKKMSSQDDLLEELSGLGYNLTQATLSRDLKEIRTGKMYDPEKGSIYVLREEITSSETDKIPELSINSIHAVEFSYNLVLIKTVPGFASSIAMFIDRAGRPEFAGTIAGDDTILLIPHEKFTRRKVQDTLNNILPGIREKFSH